MKLFFKKQSSENSKCSVVSDAHKTNNQKVEALSDREVVRLELEDFLKAMAAGFLVLAMLSPLALLFPIIGFNIFILFFVVPYYAGYQAGKRTDSGRIAGFVLGIMWTALEVMMIFIVGNRLAFTGRVRITTSLEIFILAFMLCANTFSCWLGGGVGSSKRFRYRVIDEECYT